MLPLWLAVERHVEPKLSVKIIKSGESHGFNSSLKYSVDQCRSQNLTEDYCMRLVSEKIGGLSLGD